MKTYRVVVGFAIILCYLQQSGWAAPSQTKEVRPSFEQERLGKLENASLISEASKAIHRVESVLEELLNQSEGREMIEHIMNETGISRITSRLQKRQQLDIQAELDAARATLQRLLAIFAQIRRQATRPLRDRNYALFVCTGFRLWFDIKETFDQVSVHTL